MLKKYADIKSKECSVNRFSAAFGIAASVAFIIWGMNFCMTRIPLSSFQIAVIEFELIPYEY